MRVLKRIGTVCAVGALTACIFTLSACGGDAQEDSGDKLAGLTGGVAATVNGVEIQEDEVTTQLQTFRTTQGLTEEDSWGQYMVDVDWTPQKIREQMIDGLVQQELTKQGAKEENVEVPSSEIDEYVDKMKAYYESDERWQEALTGAGTTEEKYRESIQTALLDQKLKEAVTGDVVVSDDDVLEAAKTYKTSYDGAKRSSQILFDTGDDATAQEVLAKVTSGELDFADAAKEYSKDGSAANGGDMGWDVLTQYQTEYSDALKGLELDQVSELVAGETGIHIIKCTEIYTAPEELTSLDEMPELMVDSLRTTTESTKKDTEYQEWYEAFKEKADVQINDMPENVPYNIDLSKYEKTVDESATTPGADAGAGAGATGSPEQDGAAGGSTEGGDQAADPTGTETETEGEGTESGEGAAGNQPAAA